MCGGNGAVAVAVIVIVIVLWKCVVLEVGGVRFSDDGENFLGREGARELACGMESFPTQDFGSSIL